MNISVVQVPRAEWLSHYRQAHLSVFGSEHPGELGKIDYAVVAVDLETNAPVAYVTVREMDEETVYWEFAGSLPAIRGKGEMRPILEKTLEGMRSVAKRITCAIDNGNVIALGFAMSVGFRIIGIRNFKGAILCELMLDFEEVK